MGARRGKGKGGGKGVECAGRDSGGPEGYFLFPTIRGYEDAPDPPEGKAQNDHGMMRSKETKRHMGKDARLVPTWAHSFSSTMIEQYFLKSPVRACNSAARRSCSSTLPEMSPRRVPIFALSLSIASFLAEETTSDSWRTMRCCGGRAAERTDAVAAAMDARTRVWEASGDMVDPCVPRWGGGNQGGWAVKGPTTSR